MAIQLKRFAIVRFFDQQSPMTIAIYEAFVDQGRIHLRTPVTLHENATVYVVVPDASAPRAEHVNSPRLANPAEASPFLKEVLELPS
jgi:hypothetical protein